MRAELRFEDHRRAGRAVIALLDDDRLALAAVMHDAAGDDTPGASAALLFALVELSAEALAAATGSTGAAADVLRARLAALTHAAIEQGDDDA